MAIKQLNERGQCCGRKPIVYKRPPHLFCHKCNRSYNSRTGVQIENWAYDANGQRKYPDPQREGVSQ